MVGVGQLVPGEVVWLAAQEVGQLAVESLSSVLVSVGPLLCSMIPVLVLLQNLYLFQSQRRSRSRGNRSVILRLGICLCYPSLRMGL